MRIKAWLVRKFDRLDPKVQVLIANIYYRFRGGRRVSLVDGVFEHRFKETTFYSPSPRFRNLPELESNTIDIFCWKYQPKSGDVVIDIGAGLGTEAKIFSSMVGSSGQVICVEPHPLIAKCLTKMVKANQMENTRVVGVALDAKAGRLNMGSSITFWESNSIVATNGEILEVEAITFSDLLERHLLTDKTIDFVKMNIEGAEWPVLQSMEAYLSKIRNLAISCHDFKGQRHGNSQFRTYMHVANYLESHGFVVYSRGDARTYVADVVYASRD